MFYLLNCDILKSARQRVGELSDIDNYKSLAHTFHSMFEIFNAWSNEAEKFQSGEISKEDYDTWRYNYQEIEAERFKDSIDRLRAEKQGNI